MLTKEQLDCTLMQEQWQEETGAKPESANQSRESKKTGQRQGDEDPELTIMHLGQSQNTF